MRSLLVLIATTLFCQLNGQGFSNGSFNVNVPWNKNFTAFVSYKNGVPEGDWKIISQGMVGMDTSTYSYQNGLLNGEYKVVTQEGSIQDLGFYKNNNLQGKYTHYNFKNQPIYSYTYEDGRKIGKFKTWDTRGSYNINGYFDGLFEGKVKNNYIAKGIYKNGKRTGEWWFTHSGVSIKYTFKNDTLNGDYEIYRRRIIGLDTALNLVEKGTFKNRYLEGFRYTYRYQTLESKQSVQVLSAKGEYRNGLTIGEHIKYNYNGKVREKMTYDSFGNFQAWQTWNSKGDLVEENFFTKTGSYGTEYWSNGRIRNRYVRGAELSNQYDFDYDSSGQLIGKDTFYYSNGKRHYDGFSYKNGKVVFENHIVDAKRVGRWYKEGEWDGIYRNEKFAGKCVYKWQLDRSSFGYHYFKELSFGDMMSDRRNNSSSKFQDIAVANYSIYQAIDSSERRFEYLTSNRSREDIVKFIKKQDTLNLTGDVVFKCYVNSNGRICSPTLVKGLHPFYDRAILQQLLWRSVSAERGLKPAWLELKYSF